MVDMLKAISFVNYENFSTLKYLRLLLVRSFSELNETFFVCLTKNIKLENIFSFFALKKM